MLPAECAVFWVVHCVGMAAIQPADVNRKAVEEIIAEIDNMPPWPTLPWKPTSKQREQVQREAARLEGAVSKISAHSSADIREAIVQYKNMISKKKRNSDRVYTLFIVNKFLFDIPEFIAWGAPEMASILKGELGPSFMGDPNSPKPTDKVAARWPWFSDEAGHWHFTIESKMRIHYGPPYDPVGHFDALLARFGRRSATRDGSPGQPNDEAKK